MDLFSGLSNRPGLQAKDALNMCRGIFAASTGITRSDFYVSMYLD